MNRLIHIISWLVFAALQGTPLAAQQKDSSLSGTITGVVRDSSHHYVLGSATVAVYTAWDTGLISYQLTNNAGEFSLKRLPAGIPLKIVASYIGYRTIEKQLTILVNEMEVPVVLNMHRADSILPEVIVSVPPVRMNGDTLEFNASAFKLDPNAQAEDLLRILPGVTVWGDGTITVNGRKVDRVLVNGKPFFGNDARIATQNLPKTIVDKVQVYQQNKNDNNPLDSVTEVNIKLKKGKDHGYFGKISGGYGTRKCYEADGSLNIFNARTQLGVVASANNVNKMAGNATTLLRNSTFKGTGASIEYQPNFNLRGLNRFNSGGLVLQHDFIPDPGIFKNNRLTADYFLRDNYEHQLEDSRTTIDFSGDNFLVQENTTERKLSHLSHVATTKYERKEQDDVFAISADFNNTVLDTWQQNRASSTLSATGLQSVNSRTLDGRDDRKLFVLNANLKHGNRFTVPEYELGYNITVGDHNNDQVNNTEFVSIKEPGANRNFYRTYDNHSSQIDQRLFARIRNLNKLVGKHRTWAGFVAGLQNKLHSSLQNDNTRVTDKNFANGDFILNPYLTNTSRYNSFSVLPAFTLDKDLRKGLKDRYEKNFSMQLNVQAQVFHQQNRSDHSFQNFSKSYSKFVPEAIITYSNRHFGAFEDKFKLAFEASSDYPVVRQLAPLVDSSNLYYIELGNWQLKEQDKRELSFKFEHIGETLRKQFFYSVSIKSGFIRNYFADSSIIDQQGRRFRYTVNRNGHRYMQAEGMFNRAFTYGLYQLQLSATSSLNLSRNPNYLNNVFNYSANLYNYNKLGVYFTYHDWLAIYLAQHYRLFESKQKGLGGTTLRNSLQSTELSGNVRCTKKFSVGTNLTYNKTASTSSTDIHYTLWNAEASYRLFKGNTAEIKLSAMDLLHQNIGLINEGFNNSITYGTINVLQQYFMLTLTYFPRKFGKGNNNK